MVASGPAAYRLNVALDLAVVVVVAVLSIALNIVSAVFIGLAIAIALFVFRMSRSIIGRSYRCGTIHSRTARTAAERVFLDRAGDAILDVELQGALFFGTGEKMLNDIDAALWRETSCVILDLRRLTEIDSTGASALLELKTRLSQQKKELLLAVADGNSDGAAGEFRHAVVDWRCRHPAGRRSRHRASGERSVAHATAAASRRDPAGGGRRVRAFQCCRLAIVEQYLRRVSYRPGDVIFREGDPGNELLVVTKGSASAYLELPNTNIRLATFAPGTMFGELALLDAGTRSATIVADEDLVCYAITTSDFTAMAANFPIVPIRLLAAIGRELSGRLRTANRTIHQLET